MVSPESGIRSCVWCSRNLVSPESRARQEIPDMRIGTFIDLHKALAIPVVLALMWTYHNGSTDAFVYLGMHGSYSLLWLIKQRTYRDVRFDKRVLPRIGWLFVFLPLAGYYVAPYLLISRSSGDTIPNY